MFVIVGLGNPGRKYQNTRHNLGFITLDRLAEKHNIKVSKIAFVKFYFLYHSRISQNYKFILLNIYKFWAVNEIFESITHIGRIHRSLVHWELLR